MINKIKNNESAFTAIEGLLIILILSVLGLGGYYVYHNRHTKTQPSLSSTSTTTSSNLPSDTSVYKGWKTFANSAKTYTIKYPSNWSAFSNGETPKSAVDVVGVGPSGNNTLITITSYKSSQNPKTFLVSGEQNPTITQENSLTINGYPAYYQVLTTDNSKELFYAVAHNSVVVTFNITQQSQIPTLPSVDNSQYISQFGEITKSITFTN